MWLERVDTLLKALEPLRCKMHILDNDPGTRLCSIADGLVCSCNTFIRAHSDLRASAIAALDQSLNTIAGIEARCRAECNWRHSRDLLDNIRKIATRVEKTTSKTITSCMLGRLRSTAKTREEFLKLIKQ